MSRLSVLCVIFALFAAVWSCQPPDCDTPDCGSCGNACCLMEFKFALDPTGVYNTFVSSLKAKGADMHYTFVNGTDLRQYHLKSGAQYLLQGFHTTLKMHYNDTLDFLVISNSTTETVVRSFSISRIEGALCDEGQNYKNLVGFVKGLQKDYSDKIVFGCAKDFGM